MSDINSPSQVTQYLRFDTAYIPLIPMARKTYRKPCVFTSRHRVFLEITLPYKSEMYILQGSMVGVQPKLSCNLIYRHDGYLVKVHGDISSNLICVNGVVIIKHVGTHTYIMSLCR